MNSLLLFLLISPLLLFSQQRSIPVNISLFNEATALPFTRFITLPIHPGIQLGTEFNYRHKEKSRWFQTANVSYFYHNHLAQGLALYSEIGYEYRFQKGLALSGLFGLGYLHTFATTEEFVFKNGQYIKKTDRGNARLYPSLSLDAGYYLKKSYPLSPKIFLRYQSWVEYPYSPGFIPVMTHINVHLGARFFIHRKSTSSTETPSAQ